jgi:predicted GIY-YIG superfamily endonuclease
MYYLYILRNIHNRLYIGQTNDIDRRLTEHRTHHGAKFIRDYGDFELEYTEQFTTRQEAVQRETQLKHWTRAKKEALISGDLDLLKRL